MVGEKLREMGSNTDGEDGGERERAGGEDIRNQRRTMSADIPSKSNTDHHSFPAFKGFLYGELKYKS